MLTLSLVLAVGAMGAAFASWTDQVSIEGEVNTGTLGYEVCEFSEWWVYKVLVQSSWGDPGDVLESDVPIPDAESQGLLLVACTNWFDSAGNDIPPGELDQCIQGSNQSFTVKFDNIFPCVWFKADIVLHYIGSIPARLSPSMVFGDESDWLEALWNMGVEPEFYMVAYKWIDDGTVTPGWYVVDLEGLQLEYCDRIMLEWWLHLPQDNTLQDRSAEFTTTIDMVQWNEYVAPTS